MSQEDDKRPIPPADQPKGPYKQWAGYATTRANAERLELLGNEPVSDPTYMPDYTTVYFGYGSNLSPRTMKQRCPDSLFIGLGRLDGYRWHINETQYANVHVSAADQVWGSLFFLSRRDEAMLDQSEGVPWLYEKHRVKCQRVSNSGADEGEVDALCYVDVIRTEDGKIEPDYVYWVNKGIKDATEYSLPAEYVKKYLRPFTPLPPPPEKENDVAYIRILKPLKPKEVIEIGRLHTGRM